MMDYGQSTFLFSNCDSNQDIYTSESKMEINFNDLNFEELLLYYLSDSDLSNQLEIECHLNDSIKLFEDRYFFIHEEYDSTKNILTKKIWSDFIEGDIFCIKKRNIYSISINEYDSVLAEGKYVKNLQALIHDMKEFIANPDDKEFLAEKSYKNINLLDTVMVSRNGFFIVGQFSNDSNNLKSSWAQLKDVYEVIDQSYYQLRNDTSLTLWNKNYKELNLNQQRALVEYIPSGIWIFSNRNFVSPPIIQ